MRVLMTRAIYPFCLALLTEMIERLLEGEGEDAIVCLLLYIWKQAIIGSRQRIRVVIKKFMINTMSEKQVTEISRTCLEQSDMVGQTISRTMAKHNARQNSNADVCGSIQCVCEYSNRFLIMCVEW